MPRRGRRTVILNPRRGDRLRDFGLTERDIDDLRALPVPMALARIEADLLDALSYAERRRSFLETELAAEYDAADLVDTVNEDDDDADDPVACDA